jgi:hypothetical protein
MTLLQEGNLSLFGNRYSLYFIVFEFFDELVGLLALNISCVSTVDHDRVAVRIIDVVVVLE